MNTLKTMTFSRYGSYLAFTQYPEGLYLRSIHGNAGETRVARFELVKDGQVVPSTLEQAPACLRMVAKDGAAEICIAEPKVVRVRTQGVALRVAWDGGDFIYDSAWRVGPGRWQVNSSSNHFFLMLTSLAGEMTVDAPWLVDRAERISVDFNPDPTSEVMECAIEEFSSTWQPRDYPQNFEACKAAVDDEFKDWLEKTPAVPAESEDTRQLAAYINWASVVAPEGYLKRPTMLMSKNWMTAMWSWDHCFNAMALAYHQPDLAWDQFMAPFDLQNSLGALPDLMDDQRMIWSFCKPPIHGWALKWMMEHTHAITTARLKEIYAPLCAWTNWWLDYRDTDQDGLPQYNHGNDSGWDNSTAFKTGLPIEGPDLSAFLVLQMETLAEIAARLGMLSSSHEWSVKAAGLLNRLMAHSWRGDHFIAPRSGDHVVVESESLLLFLPLILGRRLPKDAIAALIRGLTRADRFITDYGLATESPLSPLYVPDGYWQGPIWAPSTLLMVEGLAGCGEKELAKALSIKFCSMASRSGMAENYDALTGAGLRDPDYTWTASIFLILAHEYLL